MEGASPSQIFDRMFTPIKGGAPNYREGEDFLLWKMYRWQTNKEMGAAPQVGMLTL